jgi:hypothetical protein
MMMSLLVFVPKNQLGEDVMVYLLISEPVSAQRNGDETSRIYPDWEISS